MKSFKPSIKRTTLFLILFWLGAFALYPMVQAGGQSRPSPTPTTQDVNVVNTPNVNVVNTPVSPVQVRDADNPARQPFHAEVRGGFADGASTTGDITITTVPAGKVLVIEHVSVFGAMLPGQKMVRARLRVTYRFSVFGHSLVISAQGSNADGSRDYFVASQLVRMDFSHPGEAVSVLGERDSNLGENPSSVTFTISGYFVDCPECVP